MSWKDSYLLMVIAAAVFAILGSLCILTSPPHEQVARAVFMLFFAIALSTFIMIRKLTLIQNTLGAKK